MPEQQSLEQRTEKSPCGNSILFSGIMLTPIRIKEGLSSTCRKHAFS